MREISRLAPGLFSISCKPMTRMLTGLSMLLRKGEGVTTTAVSRLASSSISISMNGVEAETIYSGLDAVTYPMHVASKRYIPGGTCSIRNTPSESVEAPLPGRPVTVTLA